MDASPSFAPLGDLDGDLDFFRELFDDLTDNETISDSASETASTTSSTDTAPSPIGLMDAPSERSARRRQRWQPALNARVVGETSGWKEIATRQKHERTVAETENATLRTLLASHVRTTQKIVKLTQRAAMLAARQRTALHQSLISVERPPRYLGPSTDLGQITRDLDALVRDAHAVMTPWNHVGKCSLEIQLLRVENTIVPTATGDTMEATMELAWVVPFAVDAITRTLLADAAGLVAKKGFRDVETLFDGSQLKVIQGVSRTKEKSGFLVAKHGQLATRCEPPRAEDGAQLLVMAARGGLVMDDTVVVAIEGDSYVLVSAVTGHDPTKLGPLSRVQWYRRFRGTPLAGASVTPRDRVRWIQDFHTKSIRLAHVDKVTQAMENLLLTASLRS